MAWKLTLHEAGLIFRLLAQLESLHTQGSHQQQQKTDVQFNTHGLVSLKSKTTLGILSWPSDPHLPSKFLLNYTGRGENYNDSLFLQDASYML